MYRGSVLALDLATSTGWARGEPGGKPAFGSLRFGKPGTSRPVIYRAFREWLSVELTDRITRVVFESSATQLMGGRTTIETVKLLIGLTEHLEEFCHQRVEVREARTSDVRHHFIGSNPKRAIAKPAMMQKCRDFGWDVANDDEADALGLWDYQCSILRPDLAHRRTPLFQKRREAQ